MKKYALAAALLTCAYSASADVPMGGLKPWYLVNGNINGADAMDLDGVQDVAGKKRVMAVHYFADTVQFDVPDPDKPNGPKQPKVVDYLLTVSEFNCASPGVYRLRSEIYYRLGNNEPVYQLNPMSQAPWTSEQDINSLAFRQWNVVCKNLRDAQITPVSLVTGKKVNIMHEDVIAPVRQQIAAFRAQQAAQPSR